LLNRSFFSYI